MKCSFALFAFLSLFVYTHCYAQKTDTIIDMGNYKSYYSYTVKNPLYVTYRLSKGGGDCERSRFKFEACGINTATDADYEHSGFHKGHLANAEDFAYDCVLDEKTFCYFNCVPQTSKLNLGIWKVWETKLRKLSQKQPLFIVAGAIYSDKIIKLGTTVGVPDYCYKIVVNPRTLEIVYCLLFPNDNSNAVQEIDLATLKAKLGYPLVP